MLLNAKVISIMTLFEHFHPILIPMKSVVAGT